MKSDQSDWSDHKFKGTSHGARIAGGTGGTDIHFSIWPTSEPSLLQITLM